MKYDIYEDYEYENKFDMNQYDVLLGFMYLVIVRDLDLDKVHDILVEKCSINPIIVATAIYYITDYQCKNKVLLGDPKVLPRIVGGFRNDILEDKDKMKKYYENVKNNKYFGKYIKDL